MFAGQRWSALTCCKTSAWVTCNPLQPSPGTGALLFTLQCFWDNASSCCNSLRLFVLRQLLQLLLQPGQPLVLRQLALRRWSISPLTLGDCSMLGFLNSVSVSF